MLLSQLRARTVFPGTRGPLVQPPATGLRGCKAEGEIHSKNKVAHSKATQNIEYYIFF